MLERVRRKGKGEDNAADTFAARELSPTPTLFHHHYHNRLDADLIFVKEWMRALDKTRSQVKFFQCIFEALFINSANALLLTAVVPVPSKKDRDVTLWGAVRPPSVPIGFVPQK